MDLDLDKYARRMHCVNSLYETACTRDCITATATLLNDRALPRLHRIKALVLHASVIGDWYRANELRVMADSLWLTSRRVFFIGSPTLSPRAEAMLRGLRGEIDVLAAHLREYRPPAELLDARRLVPDCAAPMEVKLELEAHRAAYGMPCVVKWWNKVNNVYGHPMWERETGRYEKTWSEWLMEKLLQEVRLAGGRPVKREKCGGGAGRGGKKRIKCEELGRGVGILGVKRERERLGEGVERRCPLPVIKMEPL